MKKLYQFYFHPKIDGTFFEPETYKTHITLVSTRKFNLNDGLFHPLHRPNKSSIFFDESLTGFLWIKLSKIELLEKGFQKATLKNLKAQGWIK